MITSLPGDNRARDSRAAPGTKSHEPEPQIVVGLDLGTTKVCAVVGELDADGITILGAESVPCVGLRKGMVSNIERTADAIGKAIESVETMAGVKVETVYVSVAGEHVRSMMSDGVAAVTGTEVGLSDQGRALEGARAVPIDSDRQIIHALPREYLVDNLDGIRDPVGMSGVRLQVRVNLITAASACVRNVVRCVERRGLGVAEVVLAPLASSIAVLSEDEKELGIGVIDIGGGTTDFVAYCDGGVEHACVLPVGGANVTTDIGAGLRAPLAEAERLKQRFGCALGRLVHDDEEVEVTGVGSHGPRRIPRRVLADIIEPRMEEIFAEIRQRIEDWHLVDQLSAGIVLTGGSVQMDGISDLAEEVLGLQVREAEPAPVRGLTNFVEAPQFSTAVGLVEYAALRLREAPTVEEPSAPVKKSSGFWGWLKEVI